jgi:hypothetical protein
MLFYSMMLQRWGMNPHHYIAYRLEMSPHESFAGSVNTTSNSNFVAFGIG